MLSSVRKVCSLLNRVPLAACPPVDRKMNSDLRTGGQAASGTLIRPFGRSLGRISKIMIVWTALAISQAGCEDDPIRAYQAPKDPPRITSTATPAPPSAAHDTKIHWTTPQGWEQLSEKKPMRLATFTAGKPEQRVEVAVSAFPGGVGGLLPNINRWRGQLNLPPIGSPDEQPAQQLHVGGFPTTLIDLIAPPAGTENRSRIVVAMLHQPDRVWFFKMTGTHDAVETQKQAFEQFLHSIHFDKDSY